MHPRPPHARLGTGEAGFTIIEMVIAVALLVIIMPVFAETFISSTFSAGDARLKQVAATVADTALDNARAIAPASTLLTDGPAAGSVPSVVDLSKTLNAVVLNPESTTVDSRVFSTNLYAGVCYLQSSGACTTTADQAKMIRVIADVTWNAPSGCGATSCSYVSSTLISDAPDALLNINPNAAPETPVNVGASPGDGTVTLSWTAPLSNSAITGYTVTASPGTATCSGTATSCTVSGLTDGTTYTFSVTAASANGTSTAATITSTPYPASVMSSANGLSLWLDAADISAYSGDGCPSTATVPSNGGLVTCVGDKSGHLDDFAQSLQSAEPTLATINSHDALAFTDGEWLSSSLTGTYQTVIAAVEFTNNTTGNAIFASNGVNFSVQQKYLTSSTASSNWGYQNTGTWEWTNGSTATANSDGTVYALGEISRSAQSGIFANLSTSYSPTANGLNGTVGEVIAFSGTLTATQVKTIETYLVNKWG